MTLKRCPWSEAHPLLREYHDTEWGVPVHGDDRLFEYLVLDAFQPRFRKGGRLPVRVRTQTGSEAQKSPPDMAEHSDDRRWRSHPYGEEEGASRAIGGGNFQAAVDHTCEIWVQAGLSWLTILKKRENFRRAFCGFDPERVAEFGEREVEDLMKDAGIIRNRRKIQATLRNAHAFLRVRDEFGSFDAYMGSHMSERRINRFETEAEIPASSPQSERLSRDLKTRGFSFVGPTITYAFMQAAGWVNDHLVSCFRHAEVMKASSMHRVEE